MTDRLLRQKVRVVDVRDGTAELEVDRASACAACALRNGCGSKVLADMGPSSSICVADPGGVLPGQDVEVTLSGGAFLRAVALAFLMPTLAVVAAGAFGKILGLTSIATAILAAAGLIAALLPLRFAERRGALVSDLIVKGPDW